MTMLFKKNLIHITTALLCAGSLSAHALDKGDWILRLGATSVRPDTNSDITPNVAGGKVDASNGTSLSIHVGYMLTNNMALDILGAWPFEHDINGDGTLAAAGKVATAKQLPPTVGIQYHFSPKSNIRPYVGAGINYTKFFSIKEVGALAGDKLTLDDSWGLAAQAGIDIDINKKWFANFDVRYIQIETTANSTTTGKFDVKLDPWVIGFGIGTTF